MGTLSMNTRRRHVIDKILDGDHAPSVTENFNLQQTFKAAFPQAQAADRFTVQFEHSGVEWHVQQLNNSLLALGSVEFEVKAPLAVAARVIIAAIKGFTHSYYQPYE